MQSARTDEPKRNAIASAFLERNDRIRAYLDAPPEARFDERTVAAVAACSESALQKFRLVGLGPKFLKIGKSVRYEKREVDAWLTQHRAHRSTSEYAQPQAATA